MKARMALAVIFLGAAALPALAASPGAGAGADICGWFTPAEVAKYLGTPVRTGEANGPENTQCQWVGQSDPGRTFIAIQVVPAKHWEVPDLGDGFRRVKGIGKAAYVIPEFGGWKAAAKTATKAIYVAGVGGTLTADKALDFLRAALSHL